MQKTAHECNRQQHSAACNVHVLFAVHGTQRRLHLMIDATGSAQDASVWLASSYRWENPFMLKHIRRNPDLGIDSKDR